WQLLAFSRRDVNERKTHGKSTSLAGPVTCRSHFTTVHFHQHFNQRQTNAEAAAVIFKTARNLREHIEYTSQCCWGNPNTGIAHADFNLIVLPYHFKPDFTAGWCVFNAVR